MNDQQEKAQLAAQRLEAAGDDEKRDFKAAEGKLVVSATSADRRVRIVLSGGAVLEVWVHPDWSFEDLQRKCVTDGRCQNFIQEIVGSTALDVWPSSKVTTRELYVQKHVW